MKPLYRWKCPICNFTFVDYCNLPSVCCGSCSRPDEEDGIDVMMNCQELTVAGRIMHEMLSATYFPIRDWWQNRNKGGVNDSGCQDYV